MKRLLLYIVFLCCTVLSFGQAGYHERDGSSWWNKEMLSTEGTEFYVTFMKNYGKEIKDQDFFISVYATAHEAAIVTFTGTFTPLNSSQSPYTWTDTIHVPKDGMNNIIIPHEVGYMEVGGKTSEDVQLKGIMVTSDKPIALYSSNSNINSYDAATIYPIKALYKEYVMQTYAQDKQATEFALVSAKDGNQVTINIQETVYNIFSGNVDRIDHKTIVVPLNRGESYLYRTEKGNISLTGTTICATEPVAIFQGGQVATIPLPTSQTSHIYTQTIPTDAWGKKYIVTQTKNQPQDVVRITAAEPNTKIYKNGVTTPIATLQPLQTYEELINWNEHPSGAIVYTSSRAVECYLYQTGKEISDAVYDAPTYTDITPLEQSIHRTLFATFKYRYDADNELLLDNYVNIVIPKSGVGTITLDGTTIPSTEFRSIETRLDGIEYAYAQLSISEGPHILYSENAAFIAHVYGFKKSQLGIISYSYSAGRNILHPAWMLINGVRTDSTAVCEDEMPVNFESVINYDYTDIKWEHHFLDGYTERATKATLVDSKGHRATGDSIVDFHYFDIPRGKPLVNHIDTVYMIVTRQTPICENIIIDTIKAIVQVNDTFRIDENYEYNLNANVCYGETFTVHHKGQQLTYIADTITPQYYDGELIKLKLNEPYSFFDSLTTVYGCDSVINQIRILRPTYDTLVYDTACYQHLPYEWRREDNGELIKTLTKSQLYNKHNLHLTQEHVYKTDSIIDSVRLTTIYGCDSIVRIKLHVLPDYDINDGIDEVCIDSINGYVWWYNNKHQHTTSTGVVNLNLGGVQHHIWMKKQGTDENVRIRPGQKIPQINPGTYILTDSMKTHGCKQCDDAPGCDSVHYKRLIIRDQKQKRLTDVHLCDNETAIALNDTLCIGPKYKGEIPEPWKSAHRYVIVNKDITLSNLSKTQDALQCDSLTYQRVFLCPSYEKTLAVVSLCQGQTEYPWTREDNGQLIKKITLPVKDHYPFDTIYTDTLTTKAKSYCACDSILHLPITIYSLYDTTTTVTLCDSEMPYTWVLRDNEKHDKTIALPASEAGKTWHYTDQFTLHSVHGCDSVVHLDLTVRPTVRVTKNHQICPEQLPYTYCTGCEKATEAGTYTETISRDYAHGCDSIVTHIITVSDETRVDSFKVICSDQIPYTYEANDTVPAWQGLTESGDYPYTFKQFGKCDSTVVLHLTVYQAYTTPIFVSNHFFCDTDTAHFLDRVIYGSHSSLLPPGETGVVIPDGQRSVEFELDTMLLTANGCDSAVMHRFHVYKTYHQEQNDTACQGTPYAWAGHTGTVRDEQHGGKLIPANMIPTDVAPGVYTYTHKLRTHNCTECGDGLTGGCDSVWVLHLTIYPTYNNLAVEPICEGDSVFWDGRYWKGAASLQTDTLMQRLFGDSVYRSTEIIHTYSTQAGYACDSIERLQLEITPRYHIHRDTVLCDNEGYQLGDSVYPIRPAGFYHDVRIVKGSGGCDSVVLSMDVTVNPTFDMPASDVVLCESDDDWSWYPSDKEGVHKVTVHKHDLGQTLFYDTLSYTLHTIHGCDSIVHLNLTVNPTTYGNISPKVCTEELPYKADPDGKSYNAAGTYVDTLRNRNRYGCDSILTINLFVMAEIRDTIPAFRCENGEPYSYTAEPGATHLQNLTEEKLYYDTLTTATGCKRYLVLDLKVGKTYSHDQYDTICDNGSFDFHGHIFENLAAQDTPYRFDSTLQSMQGCDSTIHLYLTVNPTYDMPANDTVLCESDDDWSWYPSDKEGVHKVTVHKHDLGQTPFYDTLSYTLHTIHGCDSIVHLNLTVNPTLRKTIPVNLCPEKTPYTYGVHGKTASETGVYQDTTTSVQYGCDSITTYDIFVSDEVRTLIDTTICNNELPYNHPSENNHLMGLMNTGIYYDTIRHPNSCDSILELHLTINDTTTQNVTYYYCAGEIYTDVDFPSITSTTDTSYVKRLTKANMAGCDSVIYVTVKFGQTYDVHDPDVIICEKEQQYIWHTSDSYDTYTDVLSWGDLQGNVLDTVLRRTLHTVSPFECDSMTSIHITVNPTTVSNQSVVWCASAGPYPYGEKGKVATETGDYVDTLITLNQYGCDSILHLHFEWKDSIYFHDTVRICENKAEEKHGKLYIGDLYAAFGGTYDASMYDSVRVYAPGIHYDTITFRTSIGCDSSYFMVVNVQPIHYSVQERNACQFEVVEYEAMHNGDGGLVPTNTLGDVLFVDTIPAANTCDSIIHMTYHIRPHYHFSQGDIVLCQADSMWIWYNEDHDPQDTISLAEGNKTYNLGTSYTTIYGCDSTYGISVFVAPTYHYYDTLSLCENDSLQWQGMLFTGSQYTAYGKDYDPTPYDSVRTNIAHGSYHIDIRRPTAYACACDSTYHLLLNVNEVAHTDSIDSVCQGTPFFNPNWNWGEGRYMPTERVGTYTSVDTIHSIVTGCDSIVTLTLRVDSVYHYGIAYTFCQDTIDTMREWIDEEGKSHGWVLDISRAGDFRIDTVFTTIHGCDSTYGVQWHVDPIYRFDTIINICENERFVWQDTLYTGDSVRNIMLEDTVILAAGTYHRFKHFETVAGCDSDYYATIHVHAIYDTLTRVTVCESDGFVWRQQDHPFGEYHTYADTLVPVAYCDTVRILPFEADFPQQKRDTIMRYRERMLQSVYGCDSLSRIWVTVQPTYCFLSDTTICANDRVKYRGKYFSSRDTTYIDRQYTEDGCDSVYILRLHVRPTFMNVRRVTMCDNETLYHKSINHDDPVWNPGDEIRDPEWEYYDMIYTDKNGCDSIYRYYLTIYPAYKFIDSTVVLCSADSILLHGNRYVGENTEFPVDTFVLPYHAYYADTLKTIHGCDSVYGIYASIYPSYRHIDTMTICENEAAVWRSHRYEGRMYGNVLGNGLSAGEHIFRDSLQTKDHGCDSIYELRLVVHPTYLFEEHTAKCADEDMTWRAFNLDHLPVGQYFFYDSLTTADFGCDSVYHLFLTVNDTTSEVRYDTICRTEVYDFHGVGLTEPGYYYDTTLNEWGCHHFTHLNLFVIEPTIPTAWADSICADDKSYELYVTYSGELEPVGFSLYYDDEGHYYGFTDIIDSAILDISEIYPLTLPMPLRDGDTAKYPKPNYYNIKLVLDNGICTNPDLCSADTSIVLSYPSWITRQRFGDVIAIYNDKYNGGYYWNEYQWYHGDSLMEGETHEYLYVPDGLVIGDQYYVRLTREGETQSFQTCPITIVADPVNNDYAPDMGYLSVTPTCVCPCSPYINILSRKGVYYRVFTSTGLIVDGPVYYEAGEYKVPFPSAEGLYIVRLDSPLTPEEPRRTIKVVVNQLCAEFLYEHMPF